MKLFRYVQRQQEFYTKPLAGRPILHSMYEHLRKTGRLSAEELMAACYHAGLSEAVEVISVYQKMHSKCRTKQRKANSL